MPYMTFLRGRYYDSLAHAESKRPEEYLNGCVRALKKEAKRLRDEADALDEIREELKEKRGTRA